MVQEKPQVNHIHLAVQAPEREVLVVEDVRGEERALERLAVAEELVAELHELAVQIGAVDVLAPGAVRHELADVLREAAAQVEQGVAVVAQAGDERRVVGGEVDGQVQEEELPDAGVGVDVPGFFALRGVALADGVLGACKHGGVEDDGGLVGLGWFRGESVQGERTIANTCSRTFSDGILL